MKIRPVRAELFYADRRTDRHDEGNRRYFQNTFSSAVFYQHNVFPSFVPATFALCSIKLTFFNRRGVCLLRGTKWIIIYNILGYI